jgi:hypothetical protein
MEIEDLQKRCNEHQRQLTQLFELYERSKVHNDNRAFVLHQSLSTLQSQLEGLSREARNTNRAFEHLQMALRSFGAIDILKQYKQLEKTMKALESQQKNMLEVMIAQATRSDELERSIRRVLLFGEQDNYQMFNNDSTDMRELMQNTHDPNDIFQLDTSMFNTPQFMPSASPENPPISPMVLPQPLLEQ